MQALGRLVFPMVLADSGDGETTAATPRTKGAYPIGPFHLTESTKRNIQ
jgi:hypothetical protein